MDGICSHAIVFFIISSQRIAAGIKGIPCSTWCTSSRAYFFHDSLPHGIITIVYYGTIGLRDFFYLSHEIPCDVLDTIIYVTYAIADFIIGIGRNTFEITIIRSTWYGSYIFY